MDGGSRVEFHKEKGILAILDASGKIRLAYSAPLARLSNNKSVTLQLEWDAPSSSLSCSLPDLSFPFILAFGLSVPDAKGGFNFSFPSFKFGSKGEVEDSSSSDEGEASAEGKGKKKFGFGLDVGLPKFGGDKSADVDVPRKGGKFKVCYFPSARCCTKTKF